MRVKRHFKETITGATTNFRFEQDIKLPAADFSIDAKS